ncbi:MAG: hypothetical protein V1723_04760 [Candidatus Uhrbacteria bacterium]
MNRGRLKRLIIEFTVIAAAVFVAAALVRAFAYAGSLTPSAAPAATMKTIQEVYDPLVGTFDASGVTGSSAGDAIQLARCAITKIQGGSCS